MLLSDHSIAARFKSFTAKETRVRHGIPQDSPFLGFLFQACINDISLRTGSLCTDECCLVLIHPPNPSITHLDTRLKKIDIWGQRQRVWMILMNADFSLTGRNPRLIYFFSVFKLKSSGFVIYLSGTISAAKDHNFP
jgi:hypothetical protein